MAILIGCKSKKDVDDKTIYKTTSGKSISIIETHPVGESLSTVVVQTINFENNSIYTLTDIDPVSNIVIADIDANGFDEIYLITESVGSGSYSNIIGYASNKDKSLTPIYIPEISDKDELFNGYIGHDTYIFHKNKIIRKFPIYKDGDSNAEPTGGTQEIIYLLKKGEASWQLEIERVFSEMVQIIRDCTGTYIRMNEKDFKVCNEEAVKNIDSDTSVNLTFQNVDSCPVDEDVVTCMMYHKNAGFVEVTSFNY